MTQDVLPLDADYAAFVEGGVSIMVAARSEDNATTVARAAGCRVSADRRQVTVLLSAAQSGELLADLRSNGVIAVVFSQPSTHRALQLKGRDATVAPLTADDPHLLVEYRRRLAEEVQPHGFSDRFVGALLATAAADVVAVVFTPEAAFVQTPGPKAGTPLAVRE